MIQEASWRNWGRWWVRRPYWAFSEEKAIHRWSLLIIFLEYKREELLTPISSKIKLQTGQQPKTPSMINSSSPLPLLLLPPLLTLFQPQWPHPQTLQKLRHCPAVGTCTAVPSARTILFWLDQSSTRHTHGHFLHLLNTVSHAHLPCSNFSFFFTTLTTF